ncbi:MAG TPA: hypothetical protein VK302_05540 [Terriglobales bacterium]|nr:hypothetical protein [Terriglobales bacterium]
MAPSSKTARVVLLSSVLVCLATRPVEAAELKKEAAAAFDRYIGASEGRIKSELTNGLFLFIDELPAARRMDAYAQLREGKVLVKQVNTKEKGHPIEVPHGLVHDWIGLLFISNSSLAQTLAVVQDYDNHQNIYKPEIRHSKLLNRNGDNFKVFLQFYKKSLVTVVINADFDISYERLGTNRAVSRSHSTRLAEVENAGQTDEHELPVDDAHGYLWRLHSYWRFEEKDGGVYVQLESIGLSRAVPAIIGWLVNPLLRSIPRGTLSSLLGATRVAVTALRTKRDSHGAMANRSCYRKEKENSGVILITNFRSLFIQRTSSASFGTQDLFFGQIEMAHYEFARLQRVRPAGVGQIVSRQFQGAIFCRRYQVDAVSTVQSDFIDIHELLRSDADAHLRRRTHGHGQSPSILAGGFSPVSLELLNNGIRQSARIKRRYCGRPDGLLRARIHESHFWGRPPYNHLGGNDCALSLTDENCVGFLRPRGGPYCVPFFETSLDKERKIIR